MEHRTSAPTLLLLGVRFHCGARLALDENGSRVMLVNAPSESQAMVSKVGSTSRTFGKPRERPCCHSTRQNTRKA